MSILLIGASSATGRLLVKHLPNCGPNVKVSVESLDNLPTAIRRHANLSIIQANVLDLSEVTQHVHGCAAVAPHPGHGMRFKGVYCT